MAEKPAPLHLFADVLSRVQAICASLAAQGNWPDGVDLSRVVVEPPRVATYTKIATTRRTPTMGAPRRNQRVCHQATDTLRRRFLA